MMDIPLRYIFGCKHPRREIHATVIFENGLKLPAAFCKNCIDEKKSRENS